MWVYAITIFSPQASKPASPPQDSGLIFSSEIHNKMLKSILNPSPQKAKCFLRRNLPIAAIPLALACGGNGKGIISTLGPQQPQQPTSAQASQAKYEDSGNKQTDASGTATLTYPSGEAVRVRIKNASGQTLPNISVR